MIPPSDGFCHAMKGLLTLRECGRHALSACENCGAGLCEDHRILTGEGVFCPDCAARDNRFADLDDERLERARYRMGNRQYYEAGIYYDFTHTDFETFDARADEGGESARAEGALAVGGEGDDDVSDSDDPDSFMES
ncbi:MAG: hypothetical protein ABFD97_01700 [Syntrophobacter sp.]